LEPRLSFRGADVVEVLEKIGARGRLITKARILRRQRLHPLDQAASARLTTDRLRLIASLPAVRVSMSAETILE